MDSLLGHILGNAQQVQSQLGLAAHGIHVGQGVGSGDLAEKPGIIHHGREEVHSLDQGQVIGNLVNGSIIALVEANQQVGIIVDLQTFQQLSQHTGADLCAAAAAACQLG